MGDPSRPPHFVKNRRSAIVFSRLVSHGGAVPGENARAPVMTAPSSLLDDLEKALGAGSNAQRIEMLSRINDLFVGDAHRYSAVQIDLFDEVIAKLTVAIEAK